MLLQPHAPACSGGRALRVPLPPPPLRIQLPRCRRCIATAAQWDSSSDAPFPQRRRQPPTREAAGEAEGAPPPAASPTA